MDSINKYLEKEDAQELEDYIDNDDNLRRLILCLSSNIAIESREEEYKQGFKKGYESGYEECVNPRGWP